MQPDDSKDSETSTNPKDGACKEEPQRRAPQKRAIESRNRILDAAERIFAAHGYDGATVRDIATAAGVPVGLVHHHGGGKEALFAEVVGRRASDLSELRLKALEDARAAGPLTTESILGAFISPYFERASNGGPQWLAYARLVAHISADRKLNALAAAHFDPTAKVFIRDFAAIYPHASETDVAECFLYMVAAMLGLLTSRFRIEALSGAEGGEAEGLMRFCIAGFDARLGPRGA